MLVGEEGGEDAEGGDDDGPQADGGGGHATQ